MRRVTRLFNVLLLMALFFSGFSPALGTQAAAPAAAGSSDLVRFTFNNRTGGTIAELTFKGPQVYVFKNVSMGRTDYSVVKGKYQIIYQTICATKVKVRESIVQNHAYESVHCGTSDITFENMTGAPFEMTLTLKGVKEYHFRVPVGKSKFTVFSGSYRFVAETTCGTRRGQAKIIPVRVQWRWYCKKPKF